MLYNFIICEDNLFYQNKILSIVDKISFKFKLKCQRFVYNDFNEDFEKIIDQDLTNKIYILDIETNSNTGTNIARKIRQTDMKSIIIFVTSFFNKYLNNAIEECLFLNYINKRDDYEAMLYKTLENNFKKNHKSVALCIKNQDIIYSCKLDDIQYIYFDSKKRKSVIYESEEFQVNTYTSLNDIYKELDDRFIYCFKSIIINTEQIKLINKKRKSIHLKNGIIINKVSENYLKEIIKKLDTLYKK